MSHTEQMREAFERYFLESRKSKGANRRPTFARHPDDTYTDDHTQRHWWTWQNAQTALAAPAAEVPEAMGDDLLFRLADDHSDSSAGPVGQASDFWVFKQQSLRDFSKALNDALQSTRLRGGVPERRLIGWRTENFLWETNDPDKARNWEPNVGVLPIFEGDPNTKLTAAPQAPADAVDAVGAGVVRDAERWRKFVSLDYKVRREWAANLSLTPVLTEWVDALSAAQAGNGGA